MSAKNSKTFYNWTPACPVVLFEKSTGEDGKMQPFTIHCTKMNFSVECYISTAIITMEGYWKNRTEDPLNCVFGLPTSGTIMNITINIGTERVLTTAIISKEDAKKLVQNDKKRKILNMSETFHK